MSRTGCRLLIGQVATPTPAQVCGGSPYLLERGLLQAEAAELCDDGSQEELLLQRGAPADTRVPSPWKRPAERQRLQPPLT